MLLKPQPLYSTKKKQKNKQDLKEIVNRWRGYLARQEWQVTSHSFWCTWKAHRHLADTLDQGSDPATVKLWQELKTDSSLLIFKGDLNFRKLVYDCKYPSTTPFSESLGESFKKECPPIVSLRTNKSDPIVGLEQGKEEKLVKLVGGNDWRWSGKFAIALFYSGN